MKIINYLQGGMKRIGVLRDGAIADLSEPFSRYGLRVDSLDSLLEMNLLDRLDGALSESSTSLKLSETTLLPPIQRPEKIMLAAVNYYSHEREQGVNRPEMPYLFTKFRNALAGPYDDVLLPKASSKMDYEGELAVIIGKKGKYIKKTNALEHVLGFAVANDISFRDLQFPLGWPSVTNPYGQNWLRGKSLDSAFPLGPYAVTIDEIGDPHSLGIRTTVNGELRQDGSTSDMIFGVDELIEYASNGITLLPGDVISTGTPQGVAAFSQKTFLKDGDVVEVTVSRVGYIRNRVKREQ
ncbi:MAG: fumarylacetoacetate hydrolase family protein [Nitrososphaerota archaeon]|jgi:2-keto-4-pentenoate hydratase/2-oxohepta-3-ene-1,7-dioic acid hydratase in catechol pathway|nr:fumarylacetoacetate hydrolase family protein [Nitrososphaerota archaeon]MDG6932932.1 fumarylacetoacetate hydrolase family protein [Nitrososphaerota archaeon]MDG6936353.1 fumarylacetoacetate hydrolase family protein [Nitrososphaerota archaeon]MDG6943925.1 fumarylacetoacetate hydrolase family protein [Nitrososphaerota archaeon]